MGVHERLSITISSLLSNLQTSLLCLLQDMNLVIRILSNAYSYMAKCWHSYLKQFLPRRRRDRTIHLPISGQPVQPMLFVIDPRVFYLHKERGVRGGGWGSKSKNNQEIPLLVYKATSHSESSTMRLFCIVCYTTFKSASQTLHWLKQNK